MNLTARNCFGRQKHSFSYMWAGKTTSMQNESFTTEKVIVGIGQHCNERQIVTGPESRYKSTSGCISRLVSTTVNRGGSGLTG